MESALQAFQDRLVASDPGLTRLRTALRVLVTVVLTVAVLALVGLPGTAVMLGAIVSMISSFTVKDPDPAGKAVTFLLLPVAAGASLVTEAVLEPYRLASDLAFLAVVFGAVYLRRFGARGFAIGMTGFMTYFFTLFLHATTASLRALSVSAVLGLACSALSHLLLVRGHPDRTLTAVVAGFRARTAQVVDAVSRLLEVAHPGRPDEEQLRRQVGRLHESALMIESRLDEDSSDMAGTRKRHLIAVELAAEQVARWAVRAVAETMPATVRSDVLAELAVLRALLGRDRRRALAADVDSAGFGRAATADGAGPGTRGLGRAIRDLATAIVTARRSIDASEDSEATEAAGLPPRVPPGDARPDAPPPVTGEGPAPGTVAETATAETAVTEATAATGTGTGTASATDTAGTGLRPTTRQALQATVAAALAIAGGTLASGQRWYWAVIAAFVVFGNTTSRGDILVKGYRRMLGTLLGIVAGIAGATAMSGHQSTTVVLIFVCVFFAYYLAQVSYSVMTFFTTVALGLLYSLLGTFTPAVLMLRLEETVIGAVAGVLAAVLVLPTSTTATIRSGLAELLRTLQRFVGHAEELVVDGRPHDLIDEVRDIDRRLADLQKAAAPMDHPMSPFRTQRNELRYLLVLLDACAFYTRAIAAYATAGAMAGDEGLAGTARRITANLDRLIAVVEGTSSPAQEPDLGGEGPSASIDPYDPAWSGGGPVLRDAGAPEVVRCIDRLDKCVLGLTTALRAAAVPSAVPSTVTS